MRQYITLGLWLAAVDACVQQPLPPEPPIVMVISQCRGAADAGEPVTVVDPSPKAEEPKAPPSDPVLEVTSRQ
jgi:hypothetical protein